MGLWISFTQPIPRIGCAQVWCRMQESNPRPSVYKTAALPAELIRHPGFLSLAIRGPTEGINRADPGLATSVIVAAKPALYSALYTRIMVWVGSALPVGSQKLVSGRLAADSGAKTATPILTTFQSATNRQDSDKTGELSPREAFKPFDRGRHAYYINAAFSKVTAREDPTDPHSPRLEPL
jgi:hypothetical protein